MAFDLNELHAVGFTGDAAPTSPRAPRLWAYTTNDSVATVEGAGYFNPAASLMPVGTGTIILATMAASADNNGRVLRTYTAAVSAAGVVHIKASAATAIG
jgi:hypothetical protein